MEKHYLFTAALLRDGEKRIDVPNCTTLDGYLCRLSSKKVRGNWVNSFAPFWDSKKMTTELKAKWLDCSDLKKVIGTDAEQYLIKFGKVEGEYWVWNLDASEKKKTEAKAEVRFYKKYREPFDDDEDEYKLDGTAYPKNVSEIIAKYTAKEGRYIILQNANGLETELKTINWSLKIK